MSLEFLIPYLLGTIPFGYLLTKFFSKQDIRNVGSGNIGATNVLRSGNKVLALLTLILDAAKGGGSALLGMAIISTANSYPEFKIIPEMALTCGLFAILGHCFPLWLKFKGGKGVATTFGVLFAAAPWAGLIAAVTWGVVAGFTRYSSLSALCAVAIVPIASFIFYGPMSAVITVIIALLVFWRHKENIQRLVAGTESKIGDKKKDKNESTAETE